MPYKKSAAIYILWGFILGLGFRPEPARAQRRLSLAQSSASFTGEAKYDNSASSLAFAGDVNGDGYDDFLIGAHNNDDGGENAGKCYLILGKPRGWRMDQGLSQAEVSFIGEHAGDNAGASVAYAGDVNGDGYDDFLIGAHNNDDSGDDAGKCYLFWGRKHWKKSYRLKEADVVLTGEREGDNAGIAVAYAGDVNGDGYDDFLIGAHNNDDGGQNAGKCYLILGRKNWKSNFRLYYADASFIGEDRDDRLGMAVAYAGDVNGDGYDDFLIGAPYNNQAGEDSGQSYLILGRRRGWQKNTPLSLASASFMGENTGDNAGISLAYAGDVNGDGYADMLIGADANSEAGQKAGKCYLLLGKPEGWKLRTSLSAADAAILGEKPKDHLGVAVAYAGDVNGDGYDDFLIGASRSSGEGVRKAGKSYLFWGKAAGFKGSLTASAADLILIGEAKNDFSGNSLSAAGDVNGDGIGDIIIGADANSEAGRSAGQTYLLFPRLNAPPKTISQLRLKTDDSYRQDLKTEVSRGDKLYIQLQGQDGNPDSIDIAQVLVGTAETNPVRLGLVESRKDSGIYRGSLRLVATSNSRFARRLRINPGEIITIAAKDDQQKQVVVAQAVNIAGYEIDDDRHGSSRGNNNGYIEAGETVELSIRLANNYFQRVTVNARLESEDPYVKLISPLSSFGSIPSRHTQVSRKKFVLSVAKNCPHRHLLKLKLIISDKYGPRWTDSLQFLVTRLVAISGWVKDKYNGRGVGGALLKYGDHNTGTSNADGSYTLYLPESQGKDRLLVTAPGYLNASQEIGLEGDQRLDILLPPRLELSHARASFVGEEQRDASGYAVAYAGDVNGDGYDDFLIGAWGSDEGGTDAGQTYLILGRPQGWRQQIDLSKADASFIGENPFDESGKTIAYAGDVNRDGFDDFLIGAPGNDKGGDKAGQVYLILGRARGWRLGTSLAQASASFVGETPHDRAGSALSYAGDVNGDGYDDFLIGAWGNNAVAEDAGQIYLMFGKPQDWRMYTPLAHADASLVGEHGRDEAGKALSYAGDVNGDGYDDFLIGAPSYSAEKEFAGKAYLVFGRPDGWGWRMSLADAVSFVGEGTNDAAGSWLNYAGDVNGDGYSDFIVGAWSNDEGGANAGQAYLFLGKSTGWNKESSLSAASASFIGEHAGDAAGLSASYAGDVNGDGYDDFLIGAWGSQSGKDDQGQSYLILGKPDGWAMDTPLSFADLAFVGQEAGDAAGKAVSFAGDVNGDGYDDFLIGAWKADRGGTDAGESYLLWLAKNTPPLKATALELFPPADTKQGDNRFHIRLRGTDGDPQRINVAQVLLESTSYYINGIRLRLVETALDSGEYIGGVQIASTSSSPWVRRILAHGNHILTVSTRDGSLVKTIKVKDIHPPFVTQLYPPADGQRAPINTTIRLHVKDPGTGVDKSSLLMQVNQQPVQPEISGDKHDYQLVYRPPRIFGFNETVQVNIKAADLSSPPHLLETGYSFRTAKAGIILNAGFEEGFAQWEYQPTVRAQTGIDQTIGAITTIDPTTARSGLKSCKVEFTGERDLRYEHLYQGPIPVQPNTDYLLMGYVKTENLSSNQGIRLYVEGSHTPYRVTDPKKYFNAQSSHLLGTNDWTLLYVPFSTRADTNYVFAYLVRWDGGGHISGVCWLDDLYLMVESEPGFGLKRFWGILMEYFR
jgi:hypothetical protein